MVMWIDDLKFWFEDLFHDLIEPFLGPRNHVSFLILLVLISLVLAVEI